VPTLMTNGWDLIAVASQGTLNSLLSEAVSGGLLPPSISQKIPMEGGTVTVTVDLDPLSPPTVNLNPTNAAGQSAMVALNLPFSGGTITSTSSGVNPPATLPTLTMAVTTEITYVDLSFSGGTNETLALDFTSSEAIYSMKVTGLPPFWENFVNAAITTWLQNLKPGSVPLGTVVVPTELAALAPVGNSMFAIQTAENSDDNALLLLMTTPSGTQPSGTNFSDSLPLLQPGQPSAFYISNRVLMEEIIVPGFCQQLSAPASDFSFSGDATTPVVATFSGSLSIQGEDDPVLHGLALSVNNSSQVQGSYDVDAYPAFHAGVYYVKVTGDVYIEMVLDASSQEISFNTTSSSGSGSLEASPLGWAIIVAAIIATFGTISAFLGIVLAIVVPLVVALLTFPVNMSSADESISQALGSATWPLQKVYPLSSVTLPGDLVIVGDPTI
jgi:hypothetical protein